MRSRGRGQQAQLHLTCHGDIAFKLTFLGADSLVQPGVFNCDRYLCGQRRQYALMFFREEMGACVFQVEHADDAALVKERHHQLGSGLLVHGQIARVLAYIRDIHVAPFTHRCAHQSAVHGDAAQWRMGGTEPPCVAGDQRFTLLVQQHDGEHLVIDEAAQKLAHAFQQRAQFQNRCQFDGDLVEHLERLRLAGDTGVKPGVLDGLGDA